MRTKVLKRAFIASIPIALGYIPLGVISGMLLNNGGLNPLEVVLMSFFVFAGSSQFVSAELFATMTPMPAIILTTFIINLRQMLYSSSLSHHVKEKNIFKLIIFSHYITDETFAINTKEYEQGNWSDHHATLLGAFSNVHWVLGNLLGAYFGKYLGIPVAVAAFSLTSMFIILLVFQIKERKDILIWCIGTIVAIVVHSMHQSGFSIIISTVITVCIALLIEGCNEKKVGDSCE